MTNGLTHTYNLTIDGLAVTAVLTFNGSHGLLLCSYDDRSISVRLGSQAEYMREDACRALKSRRVMADMVGEAPYSRKATCRSIANRLDLLVHQGDIEADAAQEVVTEVKGKWRGLQTSHDFDRFISTNIVAKQHLALCKRTDDDFETLIAPALAKAIKEDIETDLEIGAPVLTAAPDKDAGLTVAQLATDKVNEVLAFHKLPTADTYAAGIDIVDEEIAHLRGSLEESDDLASDRWTTLTSVNDVLRCMLDDRGVPSGEHIGDNLRAVVEYMSAVEAAAVKWQAAGLVWQEKARAPYKPIRFRIIPPPSEGWTTRRFSHKVPETRSCVMCDIDAQRATADVPMTAEQRFARTIEGIGEAMLARGDLKIALPADYAGRFRFTAEDGEALVADKETP